MATLQELADEAFSDLLKKHGIPIDLQDALRKSARSGGKRARSRGREASPTMSSRSVRGRPARGARITSRPKANPYQEGTDEAALWADGHERVATAIEAGESEG